MDVVSTDEVAARDRFAYWREVNAKLWVPYDLGCVRPVESGFRARVMVTTFGGVQATTMPHWVDRTPRLIRQADPGVFKLGCAPGGSTHDHADVRSHA